MGCIKREGFSCRGFHRGAFTLGRNFKGFDVFSRIMSLSFTGLDLSTGLVDKCTPMGVGYGAKAFTVPENTEGMYEMRGALAILHLMS